MVGLVGENMDYKSYTTAIFAFCLEEGKMNNNFKHSPFFFYKKSTFEKNEILEVDIYTT